MKKLLLFLMFIILSSLAYSDEIGDNLTNALETYYTFDENYNTTQLIDHVGNNDSIDRTIEARREGINNLSWSFNAGKGTQVPKSILDTHGGFSIYCWVWYDTINNGEGSLFWGQDSSGYYTAIWTSGGTGQLTYRLKTSGASDETLDTFSTNRIHAGQWNFVGMQWDENIARGYINLSEEVNEARSGQVNIDTRFDFGYRNGVGLELDGALDSCMIFERNLTTSERERLFNDGAGTFYENSFVAAGEGDNATLQGLILNLSYESITTPTEATLFYPAANYSTSGAPNLGSTCSFKSENISAIFTKDSTLNFTISTTEKVHIDIDEDIDNIINDRIEFDVCRINLPVDMQININGSIIRTISGNIIPKCNSGAFHAELNETTAYNNAGNFNVSISCNACNGGTQTVKVLRDEADHILTFSRNYLTHDDSLVFNASLNLYTYVGHHHRFANAGTIDYNVTCNGTTDATTFTVESSNLTISIVSINDIIYTDGINIESSSLTNITINIEGDAVVYSEMNITYSNNTFIANAINDEFIQLTASQLPIDSIYNITIYAIDDDGNPATLKGYFQINDTTNPTIEWITPSATNSTIFTLNTSRNIDIQFNDVNLFGYEIAVYDADNELKYNFTQVGLNDSLYNFSETITPDGLGQWRIYAYVSDSHTDQEIEDFGTSILGETMRFRRDIVKDHRIERKYINISYRGIYEFNPIIQKQTDRYIFIVNFPDVDVTDDEVTHVFRVVCPEQYLIPNSGNVGHVVCYDSKTWVDFNNNDVISWYAEECGEACVDITLNMKPKKTVVFNSIGGLNVYEEAINFNVTSISPAYNIGLMPENFFNTSIIDTSSIQGVMILFFLLVLLIVMIMFSEYTKIPAMAFFSMVYGFFYSILLFVAVSVIAGIAGIIFMVMYIIYAFNAW